jgi:hypothetical protein
MWLPRFVRNLVIRSGPGQRAEVGHVVTTVRSVLNLINIDESGSRVNRDRGYGQKPNLRGDLNRRAAAAVSRMAEEPSRQALRGPAEQASPIAGIPGHLRAGTDTEDVVFPVAAATAAGWLLLFFVLLVLPPASQPRRDEDAGGDHPFGGASGRGLASRAMIDFNQC